MRRAVVDVGSNSVLLTICEKTDQGWQELKWTSEVTGLGTDTKKTGILRQDSQDLTLAAIKRAFDQAEQNSAKCIAAATMAARIATNTSEFLERAKRQGTPVIVISGDEEARLGLEAVMLDPAFYQYSTLSVIDPGGHSTELTISDRNAKLFSHSFPVGALGLREGPMGADSPDVGARLGAVVEIDDVLATQQIPETTGIAVALGATPTNLARMRNTRTGNAEAPIHGSYLDYEEVSRAVEALCEMTEAQRASVPGIELGREKTIHVGALILERFMNAIHVEGCFVSTRGWRHALLSKDNYS